jgi:hypothetical protein
MSINNINTPIDSNLFVTRFEKKFQAWGNIVTDKLKETWNQNCVVFNNVIANKETPIKYVISAPTGSAKTENMITYCAMLPKTFTVLISTNLTSEADRIAADINTEAKEYRAIAYHSKNDFKAEDVQAHQILVVSHEFYKRNNSSTQKWDTLVKNRDLIIIDEALDIFEELTVHEADINMTLNFFSSLFRKNSYANNGYFYKCLESLNNDYNELLNRNNGTELYSQNKFFKMNSNGQQLNVLSINMNKYLTFLYLLEHEVFQFNYYLTGIRDSNKDQLLKQKIINTLETLNSMNKRLTYTTSNRGEYSFHRVINKLTENSFVCFDATADVNKTYEFRTKYHADLIQVPKIDGIRDYSNVNLFTAITPTGSSSVDSVLINLILANISFGNKTLIITHKSNREIVEEIVEQKYSSNTIDVAHWNALTGLNKWQDFDTCVVIGLNNKPVSYYQNRLLINSNESIAFGATQNSLYNDIKVTNLVAEIIQAINRIRIRKVITTTGGCDSANIYLTLPSIDTEQYTHLIQQHMPNIKIQNWDLPQMGTASINYLSQIISYLQKNMNIGDRISLNEPRDMLNINPETYKSIIGKKDSEKMRFKNKLNALGFNIIELKVPGAKKGYMKTEKYIEKL